MLDLPPAAAPRQVEPRTAAAALSASSEGGWNADSVALWHSRLSHVGLKRRAESGVKRRAVRAAPVVIEQERPAWFFSGAVFAREVSAFDTTKGARIAPREAACEAAWRRFSASSCAILCAVVGMRAYALMRRLRRSPEPVFLVPSALERSDGKDERLPNLPPLCVRRTYCGLEAMEQSTRRRRAKRSQRKSTTATRRKAATSRGQRGDGAQRWDSVLPEVCGQHRRCGARDAGTRAVGGTGTLCSGAVRCAVASSSASETRCLAHRWH